MKVLIVSALYKPNEIGGAEISARAIAEALIENGHDAVVISLSPDSKSSITTVNGVRCVYIPLANLFWLHSPQQRPFWQRMLWHLIDAYNPIMGKRFGKLLDKEKPDVIHAHNLQGFSASVLFEAKRRKIPLMQTLHDYYLGCCNSTMHKNGRNCDKTCAVCFALTLPRRLLSRAPNTVTGVSQRVLNRLEDRGLFKGVANKKVIYGCNLYEPDARPRLDKAAGEPIALGFFGRIEPIKGLEILLDAVSQLDSSIFSVIVGGRGKYDYVEKLTRSYSKENIRFLGYVKPADFFSQIDFLVVPSLWEEPLGRVIHESYSYGVPVIVSRLGGMPEIVEEGSTGFLFEAGNKQELANILGDIASTEFRAHNFYMACKHKSHDFRASKIIADYTAALKEVASYAHT